jgi:hypothetical protein
MSGCCGLTTNLIKDSNAIFLCFWSTIDVAAADALATWLPNSSRLGQHVRAAYRRRAPALLSIVVAIPGYLLSGSSGHIS